MLPVLVDLYDDSKKDAVRRAARHAGLTPDRADDHAARVGMRDPAKEFARAALQRLAAKWGIQSRWAPEAGLAIILLIDIYALRSELRAISVEAEAKANESAPQTK